MLRCRPSLESDHTSYKVVTRHTVHVLFAGGSVHLEMALICSYVIPKPRHPNHAGFASNFGFSRMLALALGPSILIQVMGFHQDPLVGGTGGKLRRPACSEGCLSRYQLVTSHFSLKPGK